VGVGVGVGLLPASLAATRVIAGLEVAVEETENFFFLMWQGLELSGEGEGEGSADGWGVSVAGEEESEEDGDGEDAPPATKLAIGGPGKTYGALGSKTLGVKIPGSLSE